MVKIRDPPILEKIRLSYYKAKGGDLNGVNMDCTTTEFTRYCSLQVGIFLELVVPRFNQVGFMTDRQFTNHNLGGGHNSQVRPEPYEEVTDRTSSWHTEITVHKMVALQLWHNPFCNLFKNAVVPVGISRQSFRETAVGQDMFICLVHTALWA